MAGMASNDSTAHLLIRHPGIGRREIAEVLKRRWPEATVGNIDEWEPTWDWSLENTVELARARRGVEPLRIVVTAQRALQDQEGIDASLAAVIQPMPIVL